MVVKPVRVGSAPTVALRRVVRDLAATMAFYRHGLGFRVVGDLGTAPMRDVAVLALSDERIELVVAHTDARGPARAEAPGARFQHVAVVASDIQRDYDQLQSVIPMPISRSGPQQLPQLSGGMSAFKFRDPDGHPLELIEFPPGVGDRRSHAARVRREDRPTLGIDHAAICVTDAERSVAFYEQFGFKLVARQRNIGAEQAWLDRDAAVLRAGQDQRMHDLRPCKPGPRPVDPLASAGQAPCRRGSGRFAMRRLFFAPTVQTASWG